MENVAMMLHFVGFIAVLITLWVLAKPLNPADMVFTEFMNLGGWSSQGLSFMVGLLSAIYGLLGADTAVHMTEEVRDASIMVPRATFWAIVINGAMGVVFIITFAFTLGNPYHVLSTHTGYPFIQGFYFATGSLAGTSVLVAIIIVNVVCCVIGAQAATSRQLWSFARDNGLPFSAFFGHVSRPLRSLEPSIS